MKENDTGWIKFHRKILDDELLANDNTAFLVFTKLLLVVNRNGVYTTGRFAFADYVGLKPTTAYQALRRLQNDNKVTLESNNRYTKITLVNWSKYQSVDNKNDSKMTTNRQQDDTKQEYRIKNKELSTNVDNIPAVYGNSDVNEVMKTWKDCYGVSPDGSVKENRQYASTLVKKYSLERVLYAIKAGAEARGLPYAPTINNLKALYNNYTKLQSFYARQKSQEITNYV